MTNILIKCPSCSKSKYFEVSDNLIKNTSKGITAVNIGKDLICQHSFIVYIDRNLQIRDYFITDFQVILPEIHANYKIDIKTIDKEIFDIDLIKLNLNANLLAYILKSIFSKKKVTIILDDLRYQTRLKDDLIYFFNYLTQNSFNLDISIINKEFYEKNEKQFMNSMVFVGNEILRKIDDILNPKELKFEKNIVQNFMFEPNPKSSLIFLKNEIRKVYEISKSIADFINGYKGVQKISSKIIIDYLAKEYNITLNGTYYDFSIEMVKNYFEVDISGLSNVSDFLRFF